jgi:hypothetical protein
MRNNLTKGHIGMRVLLRKRGLFDNKYVDETKVLECDEDQEYFKVEFIRGDGSTHQSWIKSRDEWNVPPYEVVKVLGTFIKQDVPVENDEPDDDLDFEKLVEEILEKSKNDFEPLIERYKKQTKFWEKKIPELFDEIDEIFGLKKE